MRYILQTIFYDTDVFKYEFIPKNGMYSVEKPKFLDILRLIPYDGCTRADICKNSVRSKDYVSLALKYWMSEGVLAFEKKSKDPRYLWVRLTPKGSDVKRVYEILSIIMDLKVKEFTNG